MIITLHAGYFLCDGVFFPHSDHLKPIAAEERRIEEEEKKVREEQERIAKQLAEGSLMALTTTCP